MPSKKKKYNSRFPPARIKKIMQSDDEVGKVAAVVPIIISRVLEIFVENLLKDSCKITRQRNARTLTPAHIKATILQNSQLDFLKEIVSLVPDIQATSCDDEQIDYSNYSTDFYSSATASSNNTNNHHHKFIRNFSHPTTSHNTTIERIGLNNANDSSALVEDNKKVISEVTTSLTFNSSTNNRNTESGDKRFKKTTYGRSNSEPFATTFNQNINEFRNNINRKKLKRQESTNDIELDEEDELDYDEEEESLSELEQEEDDDSNDLNGQKQNHNKEQPSTSNNLDNKMENSCKITKTKLELVEDDDYDA